MATGHCWKMLTNSIPGFRLIAEANVILVGAREFDPEEIVSYKQSDITVIGAEFIKENGIQVALEPVLSNLQARANEIYLHLDLDVLDPKEAKANEFAPPEGLTVNQVEEALLMIKDRFTICTSAIASYDPEYDSEGKTFQAGVRFMKILTTIQ